MDRTAWIIIVACLSLLGVNFYYQREDSAKKEEARAQQTALIAQQAPLAPEANTTPSAPILPNSATNSGGLVVETPIGEGIKQTWTLTATDAQNKKEKARFVFNNIGGGIEYAEMVGQKVDSKLCPDKEVHLNSGAPAGIGTLVFNATANTPLQYDSTIYHRSPDSTDSKLILLGRTSHNLIVRKEFTLLPQSNAAGKHVAGNAFAIGLKITLENPTDHPVSLSHIGVYGGVGGAVNKLEGEIYTHIFWNSDKSFTQEALSYFSGGFFSSARPRLFETQPNLSYVGTMGQFFAHIVSPKENAQGGSVYASPHTLLLAENGQTAKGIEVVVTLPPSELAPHGSKTLDYDLFLGPKLNEMLGDMDNPLLKDVMAYGWLTLLSAPMNWLLNAFHSLFGNWGWAVIGMTVVVRLLIWPLHRKSYMSMKRMSQLQPMMKELKEKYPNDPNKLNMEMMKLYQKFGVNPVSGCLPMFIQIPIFFAFYRVLQHATELRGEPFLFWVKDLARPDTVWDIALPFNLPILGHELPINILPIIMAVTMIIQMRLTPQAGDKMQQRIMNLMPLMFFAFCYNFASALALYWTTQNIISIGQTYLIRRLPEPKLEKKDKKPGFFARLMEQQRLMMEQQQKNAQAGGQKGQQNPHLRNVTPPKKK